MYQPDEQKAKRMKKYLWGVNKYNIYNMGFPKEEEKEKGAEKNN